MDPLSSVEASKINFNRSNCGEKKNIGKNIGKNKKGGCTKRTESKK